jgi:hypothetical protein
MKTIHSETAIAAPADVVWQVITDLPRCREWNPFITALAGDLRVGGPLRATFTLAGRKPRTFIPTVTALEPDRRLTWLGRLAIPKLFDGEHALAVEPHDGATLFIHTEHFHGVLPPLMGRLLAATHDAFLAMDAALARRAEALAADRAG